MILHVSHLMHLSDFILSISHTHTQAPNVPRHYVAIAEYTPANDDGGLPLKVNQEVEVLGLNQYSGWWLVRIHDYRTGEPVTGWVPASYLQTAKDQTDPRL